MNFSEGKTKRFRDKDRGFWAKDRDREEKSRSRSRSRDRGDKKIAGSEICKFPPTNEAELRVILLEYFSSRLFDYPMDVGTLVREIQNLYKAITGSAEMIATLDLDKILREMEESRAIRLKKYSLGTRMSDFIMTINNDKIMQLSREFYKDRPIKMPNLDLKDSDRRKNSETKANRKDIAKKADKEKFYKLINEPTAIRKIFLRRYEELSQQITNSEKEAVEAFRSKVVNRIIFCENGTREKCFQNNVGLFFF
jgi:hypothetical protein